MDKPFWSYSLTKGWLLQPVKLHCVKALSVHMDVYVYSANGLSL